MSTILIIEDDTTIQQLLTETLTSNGYQVINAYSGTEGKLISEQQPADLILLDLMLPGLNGKEFLSDYRHHSQTPVIVLSAKQSVEDRVDLLQNGADDFLVKPFDLGELLARIAIQLKHAVSPMTTNQKHVSFQQLSVDLETRTVKVGQHVLELTVKEYDILLLLLQHPQKIFSRKNIYESVWSEPYFENEKTINVHVSHLRTKLNAYGSDYIKTIWGVGFRLDPTGAGR